MKIVDKSDQTEMPKKRQFSLGTLLATTFGLLIAIAMAAVIALSIGANYRNTFSLLNIRSEELLDSMEQIVDAQAEHAEQSLISIKQLYENGRFEIEDTASQQTALEALLLASPNIQAFMVFDLEGNRTALQKLPKKGVELVPFSPLQDEALLTAANISQIRDATAPVWGKPTKQAQGIIQNVSLSLVRDGEIKGVAVAILNTAGVNQIIREIADRKGTVVFLLDPQNEVLAHSRMPAIFKSRPSYPISEIPDRTLRMLPDAKPSAQFDDARDQGISVFETPGIDGMIFLIKEIRKGDFQTISIGTYFRKGDIGAEVRRIAMSAVFGLAMLLLSVVIAVVLGRKLAKLLSGVSETATRISEFDLDNFSPLQGSRIREIDNQAQALNSVHSALTAFSRYVPKTLVKKLVLSGEMSPLSIQREVTVMFTDIVGFTAMTERMDAVAAARVLNDHFDIICEIVEESGGTVDKFMGDCVMAFWGAPEVDVDHAQNALGAALKISEAFTNAKPSPAELKGTDVKLRIGVHTGRVIIGDIGGAERRNYTIIGDTVNVAQRMEQLGKEFSDPQKVIIVASSTTVEKTGFKDQFNALGTWQLRGREQPVTIFAKGASKDSVLPEQDNVVQFPAS